VDSYINGSVHFSNQIQRQHAMASESFVDKRRIPEHRLKTVSEKCRRLEFALNGRPPCATKQTSVVGRTRATGAPKHLPLFLLTKQNGSDSGHGNPKYPHVRKTRGSKTTLQITWTTMSGRHCDPDDPKKK
jgi:hypothetical protein